jgi:hypothetical protein
MSNLFDVDGPRLDLGYQNLKAGRSEFDPHFRNGFAKDPHAHFWEMELGCTLLNAGRRLLPTIERQRNGGQPDLCVLEDNRRIWIEAIAPDVGQIGPDQLVQPVPINRGGSCVASPIREAQLRVTSAFATKSRKISQYLQQGVIANEDTRIIAISAGRWASCISDHPLPLIMKTLFPIGDNFVTFDRETEDILEEGFHFAPDIHRAARPDDPIPKTAFLHDGYAHISGVIWSRNGIGNLLLHQSRPITYVHNPFAQVPLPTLWGVWDKEFVTMQLADEWEAIDILAPVN